MDSIGIHYLRGTYEKLVFNNGVPLLSPISSDCPLKLQRNEEYWNRFKKMLEDSWWIYITHYEWKSLSNDDLEKEIF